MFRSTPEGRRALLAAMRRSARVFAPPPRLTVSQWADANRRLSSLDSVEAGQWRTSRAEYQRGMMDAFSDPEVESIVIQASAQTGKTQVINNCLGYRIDQDPGPMLMVQPTKEDAQEWSKDRFMEGMVNVSPCFRGKISEERTKDAKNTIAHKRFPGGQITVAWSNSPSRLASRPIRDVFLDEVDKYKIDQRQGDPKQRAKNRTKNFWNRKIVEASTPTLRGASAVENDLSKSDKRRFHVPCLHCNEMGPISFFEEDELAYLYDTAAQFHIAWPKENGRHLPDKAHLVCHRCGAMLEENERLEMISRGQWVAENPGGKVAGFHISAVYAPWTTLAEIADEFLKARSDPEALRMFYNETIGVSWEIQGETLKDSTLLARREAYPAPVPAAVVVLTCGVDVQGDRLEAEVKGWGLGEESWSITRRVFIGDPAQHDVWRQLDQFLETRFLHESGVSLHIICTFIDSAGHHTRQVYAFCKSRAVRHIYACIGRDGVRPLVSQPKRLPNGCFLFTVGVDTAKEFIYRRLTVDQYGPGYQHFPLNADYDEEYFKQLTAEKLVTKYKEYRPKKVWMKQRVRNEALDLNVYALAALEARRVDMEKAKAALENQAEQIKRQKNPEPRKVILGTDEPADPPKPKRRVARPSGWVNGWRD
jgi:phage terminase large subunit GpA-like protein